MKITPPGRKARAILERDRKFISGSLTRSFPLVVESGKGSILKDVDGNSYIDFNSGVGCLVVGASHPKVVKSIKTQSEKFLHYSLTDFYYETAVKLAEALCEITPGSFEKKVFFGNSGTEAFEAAIKVARWHTRRHQFIGFIGGFHGRTVGSLSFTSSKPEQRRHFSPLMPGVNLAPYPYAYRCPFKCGECDYRCVDYIKEMMLEKFLPAEEVAAIAFEPVLGEGGYVFPPDDYFRRLKKIADEFGILTVDDEVQSGMGRTGKWFAIEHWGIEPDIICVSKALASGLPLSSTVARDELMGWGEGSHATTFGGNPVACEAALATISVVKEDKLVQRADRIGRQILKRLKEMHSKYQIIGDVRGKGLMIGVELVRNRETKEPADKEAKEIVTRCFRRGVAILTCGVSTIRIFPALNIPEELVDKGLDILEDVIAEVRKQIV